MSTREIRRHKMTPHGKIFFTAEEEEARDAEEQAWADGANDRAAAANRAKRNQLLADSDWTQMNDSPLSNEDKTSWATYRQSLRDITADESWPDVTFPDTP